MCSYMHAELERRALYNDELKSLKDFMRDMTSQYQTSLGLGKSFPNDSSARKNRSRNRFARGQSYINRFLGRGLGRGLQMARTSFGVGTGDNVSTDSSLFRGRGGGVCYGFQAGTCRRGNACRFLHLSQ